MTKIPDDNHIARHCRWRNVQGSSVSGKEFELKVEREEPEKYLSVNWLEKTGKKLLEDQLTAVRKQIPLTPKERQRTA